MHELALFAGVGGGILGGHLLGWRTICAVEWDAYAASVLVARQNDRCLPPFPIWDDVQTFDGRPWRGRVDVISGGFPCQDISAAGKGAGIEGERSGMWKHMARIIGEVLPQYVYVENSPMLVGRGLAVVIADLAEMGYDAEWGIVGAHHAGAPHKRDRIWIVAYANEKRLSWGGIPKVEREAFLHAAGGSGGDETFAAGDESKAGDNVANSASGESGKQTEWERRESFSRGSEEIGNVANSDRSGRKEQWCTVSNGAEHETAERGNWWQSEPQLGRVAHGVANRVDRLRCIGNGQVPAVAALAWKILTKQWQ